MSEGERKRIEQNVKKAFGIPTDPEVLAKRKHEEKLRLVHGGGVCSETGSPYKRTPLQKGQLFIENHGWVNTIEKDGPLSGSVYRKLYCSECGLYLIREIKAMS